MWMLSWWWFVCFYVGFVFLPFQRCYQNLSFLLNLSPVTLILNRRGCRKKTNLLKISRCPDFSQYFPDFSLTKFFKVHKCESCGSLNRRLCITRNNWQMSWITFKLTRSIILTIKGCCLFTLDILYITVASKYRYTVKYVLWQAKPTNSFDTFWHFYKNIRKF